MIDRCRTALVVAAAAYLALLPTGALSFWRSLAFGVSLVLAVALAVAARRGRVTPIPLPDNVIPLAVAAWALWCAASLGWSIDARYTLEELQPDVGWGVATMFAFYVATTAAPRGFERLAATALAAFAFWTALAVGIALSAYGWDTRPFHRGDGAFATYLVTVAPFLALLCWRPPLGVNQGPRAWAVAALMFALLVATARLSENRIVWIALAASLVVVTLVVPGAASRLRRLAVVAALLVVLGLLFADAARDRAAKDRPADATVSGALAADPRLDIWKHAGEHIRARPWLGYGYGLHILGREIGADSGDARVMHPHNLFVSQWLQVGAIGAALFVLMLGAVAFRFLRYARSADTALARVGALGLAVLVAFAIRNLTDDFFIRANGKLVFAACAILLGAGAMRVRELVPTRTR